MRQSKHIGTENQSKRHVALTLGALGVVFGDIGTSPLYALRECFTHSGIAIDFANILGILSLIFWTLLVVICIKYMLFLMRADNKGEGGILSLLSLVLASSDSPKKRAGFIFKMGLVGAALLYGDGVITPAISVLSAMEGLKVLTPHFEPLVIPLTLVLLVSLFLGQRFGTGQIGKIFGPVILLWFIALGVFGSMGIVSRPEVLSALLPTHAVQFLFDNHGIALIVIASVFLVVTGGEALYADMGHFGKRPIRWAWFTVAMPGLVLNYFGQGALLMGNPGAIQNPFFFLVPESFRGAMVVLSAAAAVIASQALISGVFSLTRQAVQLGLAPRLPIIHTSSREIGQIYIPFVNWSLLVGVCWLVLTFRSSSALASAYGIAVTGTMVVTTILAFEVSRRIWNWNWIQSTLVFGLLLVVDLSFFVGNALKIENGGWVPLALGAGIYLLMSTWQKGRKILADSLARRSQSMEEFVMHLQTHPPIKVPGSAIYMSGDPSGVPVPMLHNLKHNKVLHSLVATLTIRTKEVPFVPKEERVRIEILAPQFYRIEAQYGFMETPKIKHILEACRDQGIQFVLSETTFVLGRETILPTGDAPLPLWREKLFAWMSRNAERPTTFFKIPPNQVIEVGIQVEI